MVNERRGRENKGPQGFHPGWRRIPEYPRNLNPHQRFLISPETWRRLWHEKMTRESDEKPDLIRALTKVHVNDSPTALRKRHEEIKKNYRDIIEKIKSVEREMERHLLAKRPSVRRMKGLLSQKYFFQQIQNTIARHELAIRLLLRRKMRKELNSEFEQRIRSEIEGMEEGEEMLKKLRGDEKQLHAISQMIIQNRKRE